MHTVRCEKQGVKIVISASWKIYNRKYKPFSRSHSQLCRKKQIPASLGENLKQESSHKPVWISFQDISKSCFLELKAFTELIFETEIKYSKNLSSSRVDEEIDKK